MQPYRALWKVNIPGHGTQYHPVTVVSEPVFGHVKCEGRKAIPVAELVGLDSNGYAVITPGGKPCLATSEAGLALRAIGHA